MKLEAALGRRATTQGTSRPSTCAGEIKKGGVTIEKTRDGKRAESKDMASKTVCRRAGVQHG